MRKCQVASLKTKKLQGLWFQFATFPIFECNDLEQSFGLLKSFSHVLKKTWTLKAPYTCAPVWSGVSRPRFFFQVRRLNVCVPVQSARFLLKCFSTPWLVVSLPSGRGLDYQGEMPECSLKMSPFSITRFSGWLTYKQVAGLTGGHTRGAQKGSTQGGHTWGAQRRVTQGSYLGLHGVAHKGWRVPRLCDLSY